MKKIIVGTGLCLIGASVWAQDISLRHRLDGVALDALSSLVVRFNGEAKDNTKDKAKGKGKLVLQDLRGLDNPHDLPHLALFDPDDTVEFVGARARVRPLHEVMSEAGAGLNAEPFYPQVADAVTDARGRVQALPLAMTMPVLLINRLQLTKAGQDTDKLPKTWWDVQKTAGALFDSGSTCPLTSTRFAWIHLENVSVQHGVPVMTRTGKDSRVAINSLVSVKHLALLASWQKSRYFHYAGAGEEGAARFLSGECAMLTGESSVVVAAKRAGLAVLVAPLPHYDDVHGVQPDNVLPDGAGLWVMAGHPKKDYALAAQFVKFLLRPDVQAEWVKATGYLPMSPAAAAAFRASGFPPALLDAAHQRLSVPVTGGMRARMGGLRERLHRFFGEEVAFVWSTDRPAKEALDTTVRRVNAPDAPRKVVVKK